MALAVANLMPITADVSGLGSAAADRMLVITDDDATQEALQELLVPEGYELDVARDGPSGIATLRSRRSSLVILDVQLSGMPLTVLCGEIVQMARSAAFLILSANSDPFGKVALLELGADDYVTKPFNSRELLARVRALIRRSRQITPRKLCVFGDVEVDFSLVKVACRGIPVQLTFKEFRTLEFLIMNAQRVLSREELLNEVWGYRDYPCTRTVDNHILRLRQKLEPDPSAPVYIRTVHGVGYQFVPDSTVKEMPAAIPSERLARRV